MIVKRSAPRVIGLIWDECGLIPLPALPAQHGEPGSDPGDEGDSEVDEDRLGRLQHGDVDVQPPHQAEPIEEEGDEDEEVDIHGIEEDLEDGVEGYQPHGQLAVPFSKLVPDDDHGDTPR